MCKAIKFEMRFLFTFIEIKCTEVTELLFQPAAAVCQNTHKMLRQ